MCRALSRVSGTAGKTDNKGSLPHGHAGDNMNPLLAQIKVAGDPNAVDSFAACITAIAETITGHADYWYVEALTGTSFSPCLNKGEDCIGWMVDGGNSARYDFIGRSLGIDIARVEMEPGAPKGWIEEYKKDGALPEQARGYFESMKEVVESDGYVIIKTWPAWSVLSGWDADLAKLPFLTTPGFQAPVASIWPPVNSTTFFALRASAPPGELKKIAREAIRFAWEIASGQISNPDRELGEDVEFGGRLYGKVVEIAAGKYLCPGCREHRCFGRMVKRIHDGHQAAVQFLGYASEKVGSSGNSDVFESTIASYAALQAASRKYLNWGSFGDRYEDSDFRREIAGDFSRMNALHDEATGRLRGLYEAM